MNGIGERTGDDLPPSPPVTLAWSRWHSVPCRPGLLQRMQSEWKLNRGLGIANLMVIHRLSDPLTAGDAGSRGRALPEGLLAEFSTHIVY